MWQVYFYLCLHTTTLTSCPLDRPSNVWPKGSRQESVSLALCQPPAVQGLRTSTNVKHVFPNAAETRQPMWRTLFSAIDLNGDNVIDFEARRALQGTPSAGVPDLCDAAQAWGDGGLFLSCEVDKGLLLSRRSDAFASGSSIPTRMASQRRRTSAASWRRRSPCSGAPAGTPPRSPQPQRRPTSALGLEGLRVFKKRYMQFFALCDEDADGRICYEALEESLERPFKEQRRGFRDVLCRARREHRASDATAGLLVGW